MSFTDNVIVSIISNHSAFLWSLFKDLVLPGIISIGVVSVYMTYFYEKRIKAYELKLSKYLELTKYLTKICSLTAKQEEVPDFCEKMNELFFLDQMK